MSSNSTELPHDVIRLILLYCKTPKDYSAQSLVNRQWLSEARRLTARMKTRFARQIALLNHRLIQWHFDVRVSVVGHGKHLQRHGFEECTQTYHRVGGPGCSVFYLERHWREGKLHGLEILREINEVWYAEDRGVSRPTSAETIAHPYDGLIAVDSMREHGRHTIVPKDSSLPQGCDCLGTVVFKHEWISGTLDESKQLQRQLPEEYAQDQFDSIYQLLHTVDLRDLTPLLHTDDTD